MVVNVNLAAAEQIRDIALRAGKVIMEIYKTDFDVTAKGDNSPVTEADRLADALIVKALREEVTDRFPIVSEETFESDNPPDVTGTPFWLVDPLDGTREFINKRDEFTVNIALIDAGIPVMGVVHAPAIGSTYWGSRNGAFAVENGGAVKPIKVRKAPADGLAACVSRSHRSPE
jgi:3'(2'), 5'-bisphosphate nucleotidase